MDFNRIDLSGIRPGWGSVWQGGQADAAVATLPSPLMIVCMDKGEFNEQFIDHGKSVEGVLAVWIDDSPDAVLPDAVLINLIRMEAAWLHGGGNIYDHCAAGVSRASYNDLGLHMAAGPMTYTQAFTLVHAQRPVINPNAGFVTQLQRLEQELMGALLF